MDVNEQRLLLLALHALTLDHGGRAHDLHRRRFFNAHAAGFDHFLALDLGRLADGPVLFALPARLEADEQHLDARTDLLGEVQPRKMEEQRQPDQECKQQRQRAAREAQRMLHRTADHIAQHASRCTRQLHVQRVHANGFQAHAGSQDERKADPRDTGINTRRGGARKTLVRHQLAPAAPDLAHEQNSPPVGGRAKDKQQQIGQPRAHAAAQVANFVDLAGVGETGVGPVV